MMSDSNTPNDFSLGSYMANNSESIDSSDCSYRDVDMANAFDPEVNYIQEKMGNFLCLQHWLRLGSICWHLIHNFLLNALIRFI
jgi:hypothetical protein